MIILFYSYLSRSLEWTEFPTLLCDALCKISPPRCPPQILTPIPASERSALGRWIIQFQVDTERTKIKREVGKGKEKFRAASNSKFLSFEQLGFLEGQVTINASKYMIILKLQVLDKFTTANAWKKQYYHLYISTNHFNSA